MNKQDFLVSTQLGIQLTLTTCLFGAAGYWLDKKFEFTPVLTIIFLVLGFAAGMYFVIKAAIQKDSKK
ncbi:F0F1-type ATP synthase assembly protein I [Elusimicrobium simillimum]|uniref:AtpZ/AtpI family protein n=1 Tax=Elusimicrobium simillimum TaxID=3143438 RepID=UPI003C6F4A82